MRGCLFTIIIMAVLGGICKLFEIYPEFTILLILFFVTIFIVCVIKGRIKQRELAAATEAELQQLLKEKKEFDRGYYHGFQDGARDARDIAFKSLYDPQDSKLYIEGYSSGYKAGAIFDPDIEDCEDFYPEKYKNLIWRSLLSFWLAKPDCARMG
ncbi:MAG: hypothetical protein NC548_53320 [Lachnospiraceae bacterium]|nr:hypothetical protein [Lachnospiraceae bacterium]